MKVALCQTSMAWTIEENTSSILSWIIKSAEEGADLAVFPECAISGYHRKIPQYITKHTLSDSYHKILESVIEHNVSVIIGSPYIESHLSQSIFNSVLCFNPVKKNFEITSKIGLTEAEQLFFTKGMKRQIFEVEGFRIGIVFCREMNDVDEIIRDYKNESLDLIIWPSYIKWNAQDNLETDLAYIENAKKISESLGVSIINANSANSLNDDKLRGLGGSKYIENSKLVFQGLEDSEMMKLISMDRQFI